MYPILLLLHNFMRWLVLASLLFSIYRACRGAVSKIPFTKTDNAARHWTATITHIQLLIGMVLYFQSPVIHYFRASTRHAFRHPDITFFGLIHSSLMLIAIVLVTIGSARAKRQQTDSAKYKTILTWYSVALLIILLVIPWPFSPFANRPYFR